MRVARKSETRDPNSIRLPREQLHGAVSRAKQGRITALHKMHASGHTIRPQNACALVSQDQSSRPNVDRHVIVTLASRRALEKEKFSRMMSTPRLLSIKTIPRLTASFASPARPLLQERSVRFVQRPFSRLVSAMTSKTSQNLDKSTPESTWQQILSTDQVGAFCNRFLYSKSMVE